MLYHHHSYLVYKDERGRLLYSHSDDGTTMTSGVLTETPVEDFCGDIDPQGTIHVVFAAKKMLSYLIWKEGKLTSYHLTRLASADHALTSLKIAVGTEVRLYYTLTHSEGTSIILYSRRGEVWSGSRLYQSPNPVLLLLADKQKPRAFFQERIGEQYLLQSIGSATPCSFEGEQPFHHVQIAEEHVLYECGGRIFDNGLLIASGTDPCLYHTDGQLLLAYKSDGQFFKMQYANNTWQNQSSYPVGNSYRLYMLASFSAAQSYVFSPPFPEIRMPALTAITSAPATKEIVSVKHLEDEAYLQKRAIFNMQAEIKALQQRLTRLEKKLDESKEAVLTPPLSSE